MSLKRCLYCYQPLEKEETDFHIKCCKKFFGTTAQPELDLGKNKLEKLAEKGVNRSIAITGVQPKISLEVDKRPGDHKGARMTIVGLWGGFILKPESPLHPHLPENEDVTMHMAAIVGIKTADHSLIRTTSGQLAYIVKRFDRVGKEKLACEDLCQLSGLLTEAKYKSSMEKTGWLIKQYVNNSMLDTITFFELVIFSFITGNADMHLKNFSVLKDKKERYNLAPAYDLLNTKLAVPKDPEEMALTLNGRKNKITKKDFDALANNLGMSAKQSEAVYEKFTNRIPHLLEWIDISFMPEDQKAGYADLLHKRCKKLGLDI